MNIISEINKKSINELADNVFLKAMEIYPKPSNLTEKIAKEYFLIGGKRIRPLLGVAVYSTLSNEKDIPEHVYRIALAGELFHKASLIHDDIEDASLLRNGQPTLHCQYNDGISINIGDFLIGLGYNLIIESRDQMDSDTYFQIMKIISHTHMNASMGQGIELLWHLNEEKNITKEEIIWLYEKKTAEAYRASMLIGAIMAKASEETIERLERYSRIFGIAFQIKDDLMDITLNEDSTLQSCPDIEEGKPTLLFALALEKLSQMDRKQLLHYYLKKKKTKKDFQKIYDYLFKAGAIVTTSRILQEYSNEADHILLEIKEKHLRTILMKIKDRVLQ